MTRFTYARQLILIICVGLLPAASVHATIIAQHLGDANPTTEGWTESGTNAARTAAPGPSWRINKTSSSSTALYLKTFTDTEFPDGVPFGFTFNVRMDSASNKGAHAIQMFDGVSQWSFTFIPNVGVYYLTDSVDGTTRDLITDPFTTMPLGEFVTITGILDLGADTLDPDDDVLKLSTGSNTFDLPRSNVFPRTDLGKRVYWGAIGGTSNAYWGEVTLTIVPEPNSVFNLFVGTLGLIWMSKRSRF